MLVTYTYPDSGLRACREVADMDDLDRELSAARSLIRFLRRYGTATGRTDRNLTNLRELANALLDARNDMRAVEVAELEALFALPCLETQS